MLSGAAILVKREVIEDVGGFDERFHMYAEDDEWCLRMTRAGWWLVFEPDAVVMHHGGHGASSRWNDLERVFRFVFSLHSQLSCVFFNVRSENIERTYDDLNKNEARIVYQGSQASDSESVKAW
jgi:GT2 family glycosyltransferase